MSPSSSLTLVRPEICGSKWQIEYYNFHKQTAKHLFNRPPVERKLLINLSVRAGPADNYVGMVTFFLFAMITKRLFYYLPLRADHNHGFDIEIVHHPSTFDWAGGLDLNISESYYECILPPYENNNRHCVKEGLLFSTDSVNSTFASLNYVNKPHDLFKEGDITSENDFTESSTDANVVHVACNRGYIYTLFDNPIYNNTLAEMGLQQDTAFSCLFNYLFKFNNKVCAKNLTCMKAESEILKAKEQKYVVISVQVRFSVHGSEHESFFCAEQLAEEYRAENKVVLYVLITDDLPTQTWAKQKYKDSVVLPSWTPQKPEAVMGALEKTKEHRKQSVIDAARDMYISSLADVHVVTQYSGFGLVAALMRVRPADEIRIHQLGSQCSRKRSVPLANFASIWSGI